MSEARALTNFSGNAVATILVGHWVGQFDKAQALQVFAGEDPFDEAAFAAGDTHAGDVPGEVPSEVVHDRVGGTATTS
jgi:aerobic C4-dicarboxylate transport protein